MLTCTLVTQAADQPIIDYAAPFHPTVGQGGMVASEDPVANRIGAYVLAKGGNAVDAAVAMGFALAVTLPKAGNIGGGGFMMIHDNQHQRTVALDYRETAPAKASADMYWTSDGGVDKKAIWFTGKGAAVPGTVAGLLTAQEKYGRLSRADVLNPAIDIAEKGFVVSAALASSLEAAKKRLQRCPDSMKMLFHDDGTSYRPGEIMRRPLLAATLRVIRDKGVDGFYRGEIARRLVDGIKEHGGLITMGDLAAYKAIERPVIWGEYGDYQVASMPPPSSGGVHLIQMLNILQYFPLKALGPNRAASMQPMIEAMRYAYADRSKYLGDPDFVQVPVKALTSKAYAAAIAKAIKPGIAGRSADIAPGRWLPHESPQTTHFSVIDKDGNMVANTYTLNFSYGSGHTAAGTGILLNNEMDDFSARPGVPNAYGLVGSSANAIAPGKRPLSSMTPTLVFRHHKPWLATGSPGGSVIITSVLHVVVNTLFYDMNIASATAWPRFHHQWLPDVVRVEPGISEDTVERLKAMGYQVKRSRTLGNTQSVMFDGRYFYGASDPRRPGGGALAVDAWKQTFGSRQP
jgi:gamma-glutamyltranspeptidase/glutathione hydrolase